MARNESPAHRANNLLSAIIAHAEMVGKTLAVDDPRRAELNTIVRLAFDTADVVADLTGRHHVSRAPAAVHVLVVDDDEDIRDSLRTVVADEGYDVAFACDGAEALRELTRPDRPAYVVLLDVMMPNVDGLEVLRRLDPADRSVAVVLMTAGKGEGVPVGIPVLRKPFSVSMVTGALAVAAARIRDPRD